MNTRLAVRMIIAIVVTVLAAVVLYFVFLRGEPPARHEGLLAPGQCMSYCGDTGRARR